MKIEFVAGVTPIVPDAAAGVAFYRDALGLPLEGDGDYAHTDRIPGVKHLGVWPLSLAARSCFGRDAWPDDVPVPQATVEFEVADEAAVQAAAEELGAAGRRLIHEARTEPWGQTVARLLGPEGLLIGITYTPWMHPAR